MKKVYCDDQICVLDEGAMISVKDLALSYANRYAFKNIDLEIPACAVTAIIGPSGCGKTSFLNCLNRMTDHFESCEVRGSIIFNQQDILGSHIDIMQLRKSIGMIFQKPNPFPMSIYKNLSMPLQYHGVKSRSERTDRIEAALKDVGLWAEVSDRLNHSATELSGGQQQRLCIARAICLEPEVLLMDEPCSALDPQSSGRVEALIESLRTKFSVIIVTHNLAQAKRVSDKTAVFWNLHGTGTLLESGPTPEIFSNASHEITHAYISGEVG